ncbi:MAG: hypothetical protein D6782_04615 [Alphaproteobacteria bacterium]|nr:MAG: hypothetical protein D6782_04615 [Alphaproteobacteria bacterium]
MRLDMLRTLNELRTARRPAVAVVSPRQGTIRVQAADAGPLQLGGTDLSQAAQTALAHDQPQWVEADGDKLMIAPFNPPLRLAIVGAVHISQALAPMARLAGYDVTVIDPRTAFASAERFPGTAIDRRWPDEALEDFAPDIRSAVVTLTHDPKLDEPALARALASPAFYIAALGSRRTHGARCERLAARGIDAAGLARIHGPAGLAIGARTPAEIALAIMAQMTAVLRRAEGRP